MATRYNDIIKKRSGRAAYSIEEEKGNQWASFIPNDQFNTVLRTVLRSVRGNDIDAHKSFWVNGTYGTGKSHAVAVITHLPVSYTHLDVYKRQVRIGSQEICGEHLQNRSDTPLKE